MSSIPEKSFKEQHLALKLQAHDIWRMFYSMYSSLIRIFGSDQLGPKDTLEHNLGPFYNQIERSRLEEITTNTEVLQKIIENHIYPTNPGNLVHQTAGKLKKNNKNKQKSKK